MGLGDPRAKEALKFVSLDELRAMPELEECRLLARGNRLSVIPLTEAEFDAIVAAGLKVYGYESSAYAHSNDNRSCDKHRVGR